MSWCAPSSSPIAASPMPSGSPSLQDGGYSTPTLWLADGWATVKAQGWTAPLYWEEADGGFMQMSLHGFRPLDPAAPVSHVSYYEADAFARWAG